MIKKILVALIFLPLLVNSQSNYNLSLVGSYNWDGETYDSEGSDIWGWKNPTTGVESALVGFNSGFSVSIYLPLRIQQNLSSFRELILPGEILKPGEITLM